VCSSDLTGIPNNYPNYELVDTTGNKRYIRIHLPEDNPFFVRGIFFDVRLTTDISPYGMGETDDFSVTYHYDRRILPNVDLFTLEVNLPRSPDIAERINTQLQTWTDGFFPGGDDETELLNAFVRWFAEASAWDGDIDIDISQYVYRLHPSYGLWNGYLSVSYSPQTYDGPSFHPMLYSICFDMNTGEMDDLADHLPRDILFSKGMVVFDSVLKSETGAYPFPLQSDGVNSGYIPAEGSAVTSAWIQERENALGLCVIEPDGRKLQIMIFSLLKFKLADRVF
jgi:hypothetical protein